MNGNRTIIIVICAFALLAAAIVAYQASSAPVENNLLVNGNIDMDVPVNATSGEIPGWTPMDWGRNAAFERIAGPGVYSLRVTASSNQTGSGGWLSVPIKVIPGREYLLKESYRCANESMLQVIIVPKQGDVEYLKLVSLEPAYDWQQKIMVFTMPREAYYFSICHLLTGNGTLDTDDYALELVMLPEEEVK